MLTHEIKQFLRRRFSPKYWSLFFEVVEGVGTLGASRCDAVAIGYGLRNRGHVVGFEIKASRSDWLKELSQPRKNEFWIQTCNEFYVVAEQFGRGKYGSAGVVKIEEVPEEWGLIDPTLCRNNVVKRATKKEANLTLELMVYLLRSAWFCREKIDAIESIAQWKDYYTLPEKTKDIFHTFNKKTEEPLFEELEQEGEEKE